MNTRIERVTNCGWSLTCDQPQFLPERKLHMVAQRTQFLAGEWRRNVTAINIAPLLLV